ncbi:hypothetical protein KEM48_011849 [Puccinia striiformis f. sp. tritici PST-130]|nr:hypothetical protein KEM48_011849 [Puccinia striiformis f. sp. tritici PST-130]
MEPTTAYSESSQLLPLRFFTPVRAHSTITRFILSYSHSPVGLLSSVALNENDLSVDPVGLDLDLQCTSNTTQPRFRKAGFLLTLDIFKAIYKIHLLTLVCSPALHFVLGCSTVLSIHTRRSLGWRSHQIFFRALKLGLSLLILNQLLMSQTIVQTRGKGNDVNNPTNMVIRIQFGIYNEYPNRIILIERGILNYIYTKTSDCLLEPPTSNPNEEEERKWMKRCADRIRVSIDTILVISTGLLPLLIGYMLPGVREDPDPDWWIESSQTRSYWFWFFFAPTPQMSAHPRFGMVSNFAPVGWLPFVLLGAFYGRSLIRKPQERKETFHRHMKLAIVSLSVFGLTRFLDLGNLAVPYMEVGPEEGPIRAIEGHLFRWISSSWEMGFYTTAYPPDLGHVSLSSTLIFILLGLLGLLPQALLTFNPLLLFGRAPIFFYSIQTAVAWARSTSSGLILKDLHDDAHYSYLISSACLLFFVKSIRTRVPGSSGFTNDLKIRNRLLLLPRKISDSNSHPKVLQDIHSLAGCPGEVCGPWRVMRFNHSWPVQVNVLNRIWRIVKIIDAAKTQVQDKAVQQKLIELAKIYRQTERNTFPDFSSPSTPDRNSFQGKSLQKGSDPRTQPLGGAKAQPAQADGTTTNKEEGDDVKEDDVDEPAGTAETTSDDSDDTGNATSLVSNARSAAQLPNIRTPAQLRTFVLRLNSNVTGNSARSRTLRISASYQTSTGLKAASDASNQNIPASEGLPVSLKFSMTKISVYSKLLRLKTR